uniref:Glycosyltransferase 2-like domain-containing protein n=1 Tax=Candidatus Methanophagaceae archaeon ANME-1 ERB6 TaxID=2759912 RepID=A0A7G9YV32_9EURY|nr:hypothetical protein DNKLAFBN_00006 [Methanosarcinales archaeon ANME-1 ERB6]
MVVRHKENRGYGAALRTCFETAKELDADVMVTLDSDGQHDPSYIPDFIKALKTSVETFHKSFDINFANFKKV